MSPLDVRGFIDLEHYPIDRPRSTEYARLVSAGRGELIDDGCVVLSGFVRPDCVTPLIEESDRVAQNAHRSFNRTNVYFTQDDPKLPGTHPLRRFYNRSNSFVPADNFDKESILRIVYEWPPCAAFIRDALNEKRFCRYADPLTDVIVNAVEEGNGFPWHFDTNRCDGGSWHENLRNSDGLKPQSRKYIDIASAPDRVKEIYKIVLPHYEHLYEHRLVADLETD